MSVDHDEPHQLSRISTIWTLVSRASGGPEDAESSAQTALIQRYQLAIYRHLIRGTRSPNVADELFQEFALRFIRGDFRRANESRGRFRDYVRAALNNLISNYRGREASEADKKPLDHAEEVPSAEAPLDLDREFLANWRQALLDRAWEGLSALEQPGSPPYHTALRLKYEKGDLSSAQLAEVLNQRLQPREPYTETSLRKLVQRARDLFTDLLLDEISRSMNNPSLDELEQEVIDLGFQAYCKRGLERRRGQ